MQRPASVSFASVVAVLTTVAAFAAPAGAQSSGDGFLFGRPRATVTLRGGYDQPAGRGPLFGFITDQVTLGRSSFGGASLNAELAVALNARLDLAFSGGWAGTARGSESRGFINDDDSPITQTTSLRRVPLGASLKAYLAPRGRGVGQFAWIPARVAPFVGAGGGSVYYRLRQEGSFVDAATLRIFDAGLESSGWAPAGFAFGGADVTLSPRLVLSGELRYTVARGALGGSFRDVGNIDLSGAAANVGIGIRF
jgi:hypothetical protein